MCWLLRNAKNQLIRVDCLNGRSAPSQGLQSSFSLIELVLLLYNLLAIFIPAGRRTLPPANHSIIVVLYGAYIKSNVNVIVQNYFQN